MTPSPVPLTFAFLFQFAPNDGNWGIYCADPLAPDSLCYTADRREYPREYQGQPFVCDGVEAFRFTRSYNRDSITEMRETAEQFILERMEQTS